MDAIELHRMYGLGRFIILFKGDPTLSLFDSRVFCFPNVINISYYYSYYYYYYYYYYCLFIYLFIGHCAPRSLCVSISVPPAHEILLPYYEERLAVSEQSLAHSPPRRSQAPIFEPSFHNQYSRCKSHRTSCSLRCG